MAEPCAAPFAPYPITASTGTHSPFSLAARRFHAGLAGEVGTRDQVLAHRLVADERARGVVDADARKLTFGPYAGLRYDARRVANRNVARHGCMRADKKNKRRFRPIGWLPLTAPALDFSGLRPPLPGGHPISRVARRTGHSRR